jgi:hypothetical protein
MRACVLVMVWGCSLFLSTQPSTGPSDSSPIGTWRGDSICVVKPSACNDEDSKYRFTLKEGTSDRVELAAAKIVNKKEALMGTSDCRYDARKHALECPLPNGSTVHFDVKGDTMTGTMKQPDGTLWRRITLHRVDEK